MNHSARKTGCSDSFIALLSNENDLVTIATTAHWIPFLILPLPDGREIPISNAADNNHGLLEFYTSPTCARLSLTLLKVLVQADSFESIRLLTALCQRIEHSERSQFLLKTAELIYSAKNILIDFSEKEDVCREIFGMSYYQVISKLELLKELIVLKIVPQDNTKSILPKWQGRSMQFIEWISIGIELDLFEGPNQNHICNSLLKAFQVDAESDQPIYKQRFNALFKRSKIHLPVIANYIQRVEEAKKMKIIFNEDHF